MSDLFRTFLEYYHNYLTIKMFNVKKSGQEGIPGQGPGGDD